MTDKKEGLLNQKKSTKKSCFYLKELRPLTKAETEVYHLIVDRYLTQVEASKIRGCSEQAVSKLVRSLRKKGAIGSANQPTGLVNPTGQPSQLKGHYIRLHAEHWIIQIISVSTKYCKILKKSNNLVIDGNRIILSEKSIQIYSGQSFLGKSTHEAKSISLAYWYPFFHRLENEFNILLVKDRRQNIRRVNAHCSEINNELSQDLQREGSKLSIRGNVDGKTWLITDNSFGLREIEAIHSMRAEEDMGVVSKHFNDLRDNNPPTMSELVRLNEKIEMNLEKLAEYCKENAAGINALISLNNTKFQQFTKFDELPKKNGISYVG